MSTIQSTVTETIGNRYQAQAAPAIQALQAREDGIVEAAKRVMASKGIGDGEAQNILVTIGLVEPTPEPTPEPESEVEGLRRQVQALADFARRHGFRG